MTARQESDGAEVLPVGGTELERVVLTEVRRIGRAIDTLAERVEQKFDEMRKDAEKRTEALELRVRALEVEAAKVGVKISIAVGLGGVVGAGLAEGIATLISHH